VQEFVATHRPDLLWITDYRYLLPASLLSLAPHGAVNLHPSLLPRYRGRAPVNWAILHGEREIGLTAHLVDEGMDSGDVLAQRRIPLSDTDDVGDALKKLMPHYADLPRQVIAALRTGTLERTPQNHSEATAFPARTPADGVIDWTLPAAAVGNLVRAVAAPYPGAFSTLEGHRVTVWRARIVPGHRGMPAGTILALGPDGPVVQCGDEAVQLLQVDTDLDNWHRGARFS
jgi:methionyl-tRNA formyltransferase